MNTEDAKEAGYSTMDDQFYNVKSDFPVDLNNLFQL